MHIQSCRHPQKIFNQYTKQFVSVPCGKCSTCLNAKAMSWVSRLEQERLYSGYTVFFTLTYAPKYLPCLQIGWQSDSFLPDMLVHKKRDFSDLNYKKQLSDEYNTFQFAVACTDLSEQVTQNIMHLHLGTLPYLSVYDAQNFLKRFRSKMYRKVYGTDRGLSDTKKIRYYLCGEYGPTGLLPHYHGLLFFDNPEIAENIQNVLSESWQFGRIDVQFVTSSAASYVASYVTATSHLPRIYQSYPIHPFHIASKSTPIGLRAVKDETIRELFNTSSCLVPLEDKSKGNITYVPLWRNLEDRLYPKLPLDSSLSTSLRLELLGIFTRTDLSFFHGFCEGLALTISTLCSNELKTNLVQYIFNILPLGLPLRYDFTSLYAFFLNENRIKRIYYVARRVAILMHRYGVNLRTYVDKFDAYFSNKELYLLQTQYSFMEEFSSDNDSKFLVNIDCVFYSRLRNLDWASVTPTLLLQLQGFGFTFSELKQIYQNEKTRTTFFRRLHYSNLNDYIKTRELNDKIYRDNSKVRRKNEYLEKHPELKNLY